MIAEIEGYMPLPGSTDAYPIQRRSTRFAYDSLVRLTLAGPKADQQLWARSTDICLDGLGVELTAGDLSRHEFVSLQIPIPSLHRADVRASVRYQKGQHCGFAFAGLKESQRKAIRITCEALARSQRSELPHS